MGYLSYLQSSPANERRMKILVYSLMPTKKTVSTSNTTATTVVRADNVGGSTKFDTTPGGGGARGIIDRSRPGGSEVAIAVLSS